MKGLANTTLWEFLESIREKTRENIMLIRNNKNTISSIEEKLLDSNIENSGKILELQKRNTELSEENFQLLELHKSIIALGDMYSLYSDENDQGKETTFPNSDDDIEPQYLTLIEKGEFNTDRHFYWLDDKETAEEIYETLLKLEEYEECAKILKYMRKRKESLNPSFFSAFRRFLFWKK